MEKTTLGLYPTCRLQVSINGGITTFHVRYILDARTFGTLSPLALARPGPSATSSDLSGSRPLLLPGSSSEVTIFCPLAYVIFYFLFFCFLMPTSKHLLPLSFAQVIASSTSTFSVPLQGGSLTEDPLRAAWPPRTLDCGSWLEEAPGSVLFPDSTGLFPECTSHGGSLAAGPLRAAWPPRTLDCGSTLEEAPGSVLFPDAASQGESFAEGPVWLPDSTSRGGSFSVPLQGGSLTEDPLRAAWPPRTLDCGSWLEEAPGSVLFPDSTGLFPECTSHGGSLAAGPLRHVTSPPP